MNAKEEVISLLKSRKEDVETIVQWRNQNKVKYSGETARKILFIYTTFLSYLEESEAIFLIEKMSKNLNNDSINFLQMLRKKFKSFRHFFECTFTTKYKYTNDKLINILCIDENTMRKLNLKTIISENILIEREEENIKNLLKNDETTCN